MTERGLVVGVTDLLRRPGARREVARTMVSPGFRVAASEVPAGVEIDVDLVVEATADPDTLAVTGQVSAPWRGECRRCLEPVDGSLDLVVREVFSRAPAAAADEEVWPIEGEEIDVGALVADALLLALPLAPLCESGCRGPAPDDFPARPPEESLDEPDGDGAPMGDPRWAALDQLRFD